MENGSGRSQKAAEKDPPRWDLTGMSSAYCNIASATATRDAVALNLGVMQGGERASAELKSELLHRILLAPRTAQQLHQILGRLLAEYEAQRGGRR
jgi:CRISPR/Cas system-associated protein Csm6